MRLRARCINKFELESYSASPPLNTSKMAKRFAPEILRNRFATNWVVVAAQEEPASPERQHTFTRLVKQPSLFVIVLAITGVAAVIGFTSSSRAARPEAGATAGSKVVGSSSSGSDTSELRHIDQSENCTELISERLKPTDLGNPRLSLVSSVNLGGTIFEEIACDSTSSGNVTFEATWVRAQENWRLSKVSRSKDRETH